MTLIPDFDLTTVGSDDKTPSQAKRDLVQWVMERVNSWRDVRETTFRPRWDEYYRIWRGRWDSSSRTRASERSKLIAPASQIAVDTAAAELLEAIFSRDTFVDISDDVADEQREDAMAVRDLLIEDLKKDGIVETLAEICTMGALYGEFIAKIVTDVEVKAKPKMIQNPDGTKELIKSSEEVVKIYPVAIEPGNLVVDPGSDCIDTMQGSAHEFELPMHLIKRRQAAGTYYDVVVHKTDDPDYTVDRSETGYNAKADVAKVAEWHGLVPTKLLMQATSEADNEDAKSLMQDVDGDDMLEAVVTVANGTSTCRRRSTVSCALAPMASHGLTTRCSLSTSPVCLPAPTSTHGRARDGA
jgi:hypothetical protein